MRELQPALDKLKVDYKDDKSAQSLKMMELYKQKGVNPFSSIILLFIQLPIMYGLYYVFLRSGLPVVDKALLYPFIASPVINMHYLGILDITKASNILSLCAAVAQYVQLDFSARMLKKTAPQLKKGANSTDVSPQMDTAMRMTNQMKYIVPVIIFVFSYKLSAVISLYWTVTNLFTLAQEFVVRRQLRLEETEHKAKSKLLGV